MGYYASGFAKFTLLDVESRDFILGRHKCSDETGSWFVMKRVYIVKFRHGVKIPTKL